MNRRVCWSLAVMLVMVGGAGCRSMYYSAMEQVGVHKRDLLKKEVTAARDDQKEAGEQFADALEQLKQLYAFEGGDLEKTYRALKKDFDRSEDKADDVRKRIENVERVANDLFKEWEKELNQISTASLREKSRAQLLQTRERYSSMVTALKRAEQTMEPVLVQFRDHVLFLKHNLNAQAIGSLRGEATSIQNDISTLINEMNAAIVRADEFIESLP